MNPFQHGEVYVTADGAETDLDLGHYERFTSVSVGRRNNLTAGRVYERVIQKERDGEYLGATVQVIPHVTDEIKQRILDVSQETDVLIVEVGGTVGDIESLPFLEAIRQLRADVGRDNAIYLHIALVPYVASAGELKTKPVQHSVKELRSIGIAPDIVVCRTERYLPRSAKSKIALFCDVDEEAVITAKDVDNTIYELPLVLHGEGLDDQIVARLNIWTGQPDLERWKRVVSVLRNPSGRVKIAMVGKYVDLTESYKSMNEALTHAGIAHEVAVDIEYVDSDKLEGAALDMLADADGILVPHGFGARGAEGKIAAIQYAREHRIPYFGICYGLQTAVIEIARNLAGLAGANSVEIDPKTPHPVIDLMPEQRQRGETGGSMRLGAFPCKIVPDTLAARAYGKTQISERHRHRYEVSPTYRDQLEAAGLVFSGLSPDGRLVEIIELPDHPWFLGCQFHPEFQSTPFEPHPLFRSFVGAAARRRKERSPRA
jgi:CTP synthase